MQIIATNAAKHAPNKEVNYEKRYFSYNNRCNINHHRYSHFFAFSEELQMMINTSYNQAIKIRFYTTLYQLFGFGTAFLIFGIKAYQSNERPTIIIHREKNKFETIMKWIGVAFIIYLLCRTGLNIYRFMSDIYTFRFDFFVIVKTYFFSVTTKIIFLIYLIFYYGKKPCTLFSTYLLLLGYSYISKLSATLSVSILSSKSQINFYLLDSFLCIVIAILYCTIAVNLYNENYSQKTIKILGFIVVAIEALTSRLYAYMIYGEFPIYIIDLISSVLMLYFISIASMNEPNKTEIKYKYTKCHSCKQKVLSGGLFCPFCGDAITKKNVPTPPEQEKPEEIVQEDTNDTSFATMEEIKKYATYITKESNGIITLEHAIKFTKLLFEYPILEKEEFLNKFDALANSIVNEVGPIPSIKVVSFFIGVLNSNKVIDDSELKSMSDEFNHKTLKMIMTTEN